MTTIILTTLSILIAAAAALMIIFYGGDLYHDGDVGSEANRYLNAGANAVAAIDQYRINEHADPASIDQVVESGYFRPDGVPGAMSLTTGTPGRLTIAGVPANVCQRINDDLRRNAIDDPEGKADSDGSDSVNQGCQMDGATGTYYTIT